MAGRVPWHTLAKQLIDREFGAVDPTFLFEWPFARVLAVFFLDSVVPKDEGRDVSTPEKWKAVMAELKAKRGANGG